MFKKLFGTKKLKLYKKYEVGGKYNITLMEDENLLIDIPNMGKFLFNPVTFLIEEFAIRRGKGIVDKAASSRNIKRPAPTIEDLYKILDKAIEAEDFTKARKIQKQIDAKGGKK